MITREDIEKKVDELCEMLNNFEGSKSEAGEHAIFEVVTWSADNHYEGLGIFQEAMNRWRGVSLEVMEEEYCEECGGECCGEEESPVTVH